MKTRLRLAATTLAAASGAAALARLPRKGDFVIAE